MAAPPVFPFNPNRWRLLPASDGGDGQARSRVDIHKRPNEVADPIRFDQDGPTELRSRVRQPILAGSRAGRPGLQGVSSSLHREVQPRTLLLGFRGSGGHAIFRASAPEHPGGVPNLPDWVTREAYSHEVSSCGFWPGGGSIPYAAFYSYAYPEPSRVFGGRGPTRRRRSTATSSGSSCCPTTASGSRIPDDNLLDFLQTTYEAAANLGKWDRSSHAFPPSSYK